MPLKPVSLADNCAGLLLHQRKSRWSPRPLPTPPRHASVTDRATLSPVARAVGRLQVGLVVGSSEQSRDDVVGDGRIVSTERTTAECAVGRGRSDLARGAEVGRTLRPSLRMEGAAGRTAARADAVTAGEATDGADHGLGTRPLLVLPIRRRSGSRRGRRGMECTAGRGLPRRSGRSARRGDLVPPGGSPRSSTSRHSRGGSGRDPEAEIEDEAATERARRNHRSLSSFPSSPRVPRSSSHAPRGCRRKVTQVA
jgi:hypothetical protein